MGYGYTSARYGGNDAETVAKGDDEKAYREGDWDWLERSPRQQKLRREQGLDSGTFAKSDD